MSSSKNIYIHIIGIEGCGHHFWMKFIDNLINLQETKGKGFHYNPNKNSISDITRKYLQNLNWGWNMYDGYCNENEEKLENDYKVKLNKCKNWIIFNGDSYPTMKYRYPSQNIDILKFFKKFKNIIEFKFIFINRDIFSSINSRKYLDGNITNHTKNMINHMRWIRELKSKLPKKVWIDIHYENINISKIKKFLYFFKNIESIFQNTYKKSTKKISKTDFGIMKNIFNEMDIFDIFIIYEGEIILEKQLAYITKNIFLYRNIYLIKKDFQNHRKNFENVLKKYLIINTDLSIRHKLEVPIQFYSFSKYLG